MPNVAGGNVSTFPLIVGLRVGGRTGFGVTPSGFEVTLTTGRGDTTVGLKVGLKVGLTVGLIVGFAVDLMVGLIVGLIVGLNTGLDVTGFEVVALVGCGVDRTTGVGVVARDCGNNVGDWLDTNTTEARSRRSTTSCSGSELSEFTPRS